MKKQLIFIFCTFFVISIIKVEAQQVEHKKITIGIVDSIKSNALHELRKIWVHLPDGNVNSNEKYPVVYLLDGNAHFSSVTGMIHQLSSVNGNTIVPKMIVVGIPNTNRMRDLTPTPENNLNSGEINNNGPGGGNNFMDFIEKELIPYIDSKYPTSPYRTYIGHSLGGLTVINTLLKRPGIFNSYVAIDPSLWWADSATLEEAKTVLNNKNLSKESLFVGIANTMGPDKEISTVMQDTTGTTQHIRDILEFSKKVVPNSSSQLDFGYKYYENDSHGSVPLITTYDALHFIFSWYDIGNDLIPKIMSPDISADIVISDVTKHYENVSTKMGYSILPPEDLINQMGYGSMNQKMNKKALAFFKMNVKNYPNKSNVYDSLGDYYSSVKETKKAIKAYEKALSTGGGNNYSKEKLDKLKNQ
ncbi:alpha/beta hydrolase-fold protein [Jejuia spongiicola]|uniref:Alpha/beta hydrolase-fold protein n=1 Tax=Jejuia spongiicola TaxID=2942207 RepID=A0ABT0QBJ2_9FLAO|nr:MULTISPECIES: alpha/beta hydrolase-fold protein [Flavobacteriaceae]MCL6294345.1 alpha/beta hydrolase-fold protein [Jejuia spongiicola]PIA79455.1 hypothetical protein BFR04_00995 [Gaetbulibacter sp. 4G1]